MIQSPVYLCTIRCRSANYNNSNNFCNVNTNGNANNNNANNSNGVAPGFCESQQDWLEKVAFQ